jgi:Inner membrane component of T3SS, cytoplasmic domain
MNVGLVVLSPGKWEGHFISLRRSEFLIGRDKCCHLRPVSALVGKQHCSLHIRDRRVFVRDLDCLRGTFVNQERVQGERELHLEDRLGVGPIRFAVRLESNHGTPPQTDDIAAAFLLNTPGETSGCSPLTHAPQTRADNAQSCPPEQSKSELEARWAGAPHFANPFVGNTPGAADSILRKYLTRRRR